MKILLVDDDEGVLQSLVALLEKLPGNDVRGAASGGQALQSAMAMGGIDLLITDVVMEPMDGFTLRDQMATRYPNARTIFISGYDLSDYGAQTANHQVLAKPVEQADLFAAIARESLAAPAPETAAEPPPEPTVAAALPEPEPASEPVPAVAAPAPVPATPAAPPPTPVAVPVAVPRVAVGASAAPQPVAVSTPKAVPTAVPKVATATAVPRPAVKAVPAATGGAPIVRVTAQPTATAKPTAVPATPVAVPKVSAAPRVSVQPASGAPPSTVAVAVPRPSVVPAKPSNPTPTVKAAATVKAMAAPKVAGAPKPAGTAPAPVTIAPAPSLPNDDMVGKTIGAYEIQRVLGDGRWGRVYAAMQTSINRAVGLKILEPSRASDETARTRFLGDARAKAHVQHPSILAVYEAGEANGHVFYTHEFVEGRNLAQLQAGSERLDEPTALKVLKTAAEGLNYLQTNHLPHSTPQAGSIYLSTDGTPRLANLATNAGEEQAPIEQEIQALGRIVLGSLPSIQAVSPGFRGLLSRMVQTGPQAVTSWGALVQSIKALEPKVIPVEAAKISAQDRAAIAAVESARKAQKRSLYINVGSMISLAVVAALVAWRFFASNERSLEEQVHIPAGSFTFGSGQTLEIGEFWIDKYEVSIGQYAKFVQFLENHPTSEYDHEKQPRIKTAEMHKPHDWAIYYGRAKQGLAVHSVPADLNMPAITVDWWDAYAYAKWKGRELPTEQEWEKAARGDKGFLYPWGNDFDPKKVNANTDFNVADPAAPGKIDGFNYWGPVDKQRDKSPFGVIGMAGNVAEWTGTWTKDQKFPIIKGGSFMSSDVRLDKRTDNALPATAQENLGFRTVSHKPPGT
jgi:formylglycine-generating enzyme required for sulfatase activity/CheY-like chemotaxis protein